MFLSNRRLVGSLATLRVDLERERNEVEDLRREIQSYVSHVRQVESVLARKVLLIEKFRFSFYFRFGRNNGYVTNQ